MFFRRKRACRLAVISLFLAIVCSESSPVFVKLLLADGWTPSSLYFLVLLLMTLFLAVHEFVSLERGKQWEMDSRDIKGTVLTGILGGVLAPLCFFAGLQHVQAVEAVLISSMMPLFIVFFAVILLGERFNSQTTLGGGCLLGSLVVIVWNNVMQAELHWGLFLILLSPFFGALTTIVHKKLVKHRHLDSVVLVRTTLSLLLVGVWLFFTEPESFALLGAPQNIWHILGLTFLAFLLPFFLYFRALRHLTVVEVGLAAMTGPVTGVLFAVAFLGEELTHMHLIALALVALGIFFINVPITKLRIVPSRLMEIGPLRK